MVKTSLFITTPDAPSAFLISILRDGIERSVAKAAQLGFDGVDLLIGDPDTFDSRKLEKALADNSVELACINPVRMTTQFGLSLLHHDENIRRRALAKLQSVTEIAGRFKCPVSVGLIRGGAIEAKPISYTRDIFVQIMQKVCDNAQKHDVEIHVEPINRLESNFINTTEDGLEIVERVNRPNFALCMDLYHMYIEDESIKGSIMRAKDHLRHFHFSDSDRLPPGVSHGVIDFEETINALKMVKYRGFISEGLMPTGNVDECARKTATFLKKLITQQSNAMA